MTSRAAPLPGDSADGAPRDGVHPGGTRAASRRPQPARTGRRPGSPDTRQVILEAARTTFAELGYAGASVRRIAAAAGVDAALVHHYFGSKEKLFLSTVEVPIDLPEGAESESARTASTAWARG